MKSLRPAPSPLVLASSLSRRRFGALGGGTLLALSGCGGGDGDPLPPPTEPPPPPGQPDTLPVITLQPRSVTRPASPSVTLRVEATGPNLGYQWKHNGNAIAGATHPTLDVPNPAGAVERYSVTVSNGAGSVDSVEVVVAAGASLDTLSLVAGRLGSAPDDRWWFDSQGQLSQLVRPRHIAVDAAGAVYISVGREPDEAVAKVLPGGEVRYFSKATGLRSVSGLVVDDRGTLYATQSNAIRKLVEGADPAFVLVAGSDNVSAFDDGPGTEARFFGINSPVAGDNGEIFLVDTGSRSVRRMSADGMVTTIAGSRFGAGMVDGQGAAANFAQPRSMARMPGGDFLVLDQNRLRRVTPGGLVTTLPGTLPDGVVRLGPADATGVFATLGHSVVRIALDGVVTTLAGDPGAFGSVEGVGSQARFDLAPPSANSASLFLPAAGLARLGTGDLLVTDVGNHVIRRIAIASGQTAPWLGTPFDPASLDGTGAAAGFIEPSAAVLHADGSLLVADRGGLRDQASAAFRKLRKVTPAGQVSTVMPTLPLGGPLALDAAGNFYVVRGRAIVRVTPAGEQSVFAGQEYGEPGFTDGPAAQARFATPSDLAFDGEGNLFVADLPARLGWDGTYVWRYGGTIRKITPDGVVSTFAGVPGDEARRVSRHALATDAAGNVYALETRAVVRFSPQGGTPQTLITLQNSSDASRLAVAPDGTVYYYAQGEGGYAHAVWRLLADGTPQRVAGGDPPESANVRTGALPGSLNAVQILKALPDGSLYVLSENSVLKIGPA
jgi:hypothetical protein